MTETINTQHALDETVQQFVEMGKRHNLDIKKELFRVYQPFANNQAIIVAVQDEGDGRKVLQELKDHTWFLPEKDTDVNVHSWGSAIQSMTSEIETLVKSEQIRERYETVTFVQPYASRKALIMTIEWDDDIKSITYDFFINVFVLNKKNAALSAFPKERQ